MNPESLKSSFTDLVALAEKVSQLNPDSERVGPGMLRELVSLANKALGGTRTARPKRPEIPCGLAATSRHEAYL